MAGLSYLKRVLNSSLYRRYSGNLAADLGIAFRGSGFLSARAFSSVEDVDTHNGQNQDKLKLDRVRNCFNEYGFTPEQVTRVLKSYPSTLSGNVETLSPKLSFLRSILGSDVDVAKVVALNPRVLASSLKNQLIPNHQFIKSLLDQDDALVAKSIKRSSRILHMDLENNLAAKVSLLREYKVPGASIAKLMEYSPGIFAQSFSKIEDSLKKAMSFGFEPSNPMIVSAMRAISQINESTWDRKRELYIKWGWSNDDFLSAFRKQPMMMCLSEVKINKGMDVFLNKLGLSSLDIVKYPNILFLSVEERIKPRCSVLALLCSKGVLGHRPPNISTCVGALRKTEEDFVKSYVIKYQEHVLELWLKVRGKAVV